MFIVLLSVIAFRTCKDEIYVAQLAAHANVRNMPTLLARVAAPNPGDTSTTRDGGLAALEDPLPRLPYC